MDGSSSRPDPLLAAGTVASTRQLAASLIGAGHRRLAMIGTAADGDSPAASRLQEFCDVVSAAQLPPGRIIDTGADLDRAFFTVFRGTRYPTGLVCPDAATAEAALRSLRALGFRVPGDMTIVWGAAAHSDSPLPPGEVASGSELVRGSGSASHCEP